MGTATPPVRVKFTENASLPGLPSGLPFGSVVNICNVLPPTAGVIGTLLNVMLVLAPGARLPVQLCVPTVTVFSTTVIVAEVRLLEPTFCKVTTGVRGTQAVLELLAGVRILAMRASSLTVTTGEQP